MTHTGKNCLPFGTLRVYQTVIFNILLDQLPRYFLFLPSSCHDSFCALPTTLIHSEMVIEWFVRSQHLPSIVLIKPQSVSSAKTNDQQNIDDMPSRYLLTQHSKNTGTERSSGIPSTTKWGLWSAGRLRTMWVHFIKLFCDWLRWSITSKTRDTQRQEYCKVA